MKKLTMALLVLTLFSVSAISQVGQIQQVKIISFNVKNQLPSMIDNWNNTPGALLLVAQVPPSSKVESMRLMIQIRSNGSIVCSNNAAGGISVDRFNTRSFSTGELTGNLSCHELKEGSYTICAQFFNIDRVAISNEVCKDFSVEIPKEIDYSPPTLITPDNGKAFSEAELQRPLMFRWTSPVPKPKETVTYRLRVWQLMQGQQPQTAMKSNQPIVTKEVDNITQAIVTGIITGPCRPPYMCDFIWDVQSVNHEGKPIGRNEGTSEPWTFSAKQSGEINPPVNISPSDKKSFGLEEAKSAIRFTWKPIDPQQPGPITYRLRVWQLMQGQQPQTAMRSNTPLVTKDIANGTETIVTGIITGPCRPPYMCDFIWDVQALNSGGHPVGTNEGTSEPTGFVVQTQYIIQLDSLKVKCTDQPGQYSFSYIITNLNNTVAEFQNISIYSSVPAGATLTSYSPTLGTTIPASGGTLTVTGIINGAPNLSVVCIKTKIQKLGDPGKNAEDYLCDSVKACVCEACNDKTTNINIVPTNNIVINGNNTISINQPITITTTPTKLVKNIKAELVYFEFTPESEDCLPCNKDSKTFGNFDNGTLAAVTGIGGGTHSLQWNYTPPKNFAGGNTAAITITLPPTVGCCSASIRWCIRWVVTFVDCTVCNKLVCYETKKAGCANGNPNPNGQK